MATGRAVKDADDRLDRQHGACVRPRQTYARRTPEGESGADPLACAIIASIELGALLDPVGDHPAAWGQSGGLLERYTLEGSADRVREAAGGAELAGVRQTTVGIRVRQG